MRVPFTVPGPRAFDVVAVGENSLDLLAVVAPTRLAAGKQQLDDFRLEPGGQMATAALGCARLGLRTRFVGVFGADEWSARARAPLDAAGVDVVAVTHPGTPGRIAVVLVAPDGERTVFERRDPRLVLPPDAVPDQAIADARILMADATQPDATLRALAVARQAGTISICDVERVSPEADAILATVDVAVVPGPFATAWAGTDDLRAALERLSEHCRHASLVIATCGANGSLARCGGAFVSTEGFRVAVVDTTGAGDAFRAGLAAGLIHLGAGADLADLLRFANVTGALNCRALGAQAGLPSLVEVQRDVTNLPPGLSK